MIEKIRTISLPATRNKTPNFDNVPFSNYKTKTETPAATKKTAENGHTDDIKDESIAKNFNEINCSNSAVDMERLFWHTHGSMLWHCENR